MSKDRDDLEKFKACVDAALSTQSIPVRAVGGSLVKMLCMVLLSLIDRVEKLEGKDNG